MKNSEQSMIFSPFRFTFSFVSWSHLRLSAGLSGSFGCSRPGFSLVVAIGLRISARRSGLDSSRTSSRYFGPSA